MEPLGAEGVARVVQRSNLSVALSQQQLKSVLTLSQGHPLALGLIVNHLADAATAGEVDAILTGTEPYAGDIDAIYHSHWNAISSDTEMIYLLAQIARLRRHVDIGWLHSFVPLATITKLKTQLKHLFYREADGRWFFFHNSFRLFLRQNTGQLVAETAEANERGLHKVLAEQCSKGPATSPWAWEVLYHRIEAGEDQTVIEIATSKYFRQQLADFRPIDAIVGAIRYAMRSAKVRSDLTAIIRLVLLAAEFDQRAQGLNTSDVADTLLRIAEVDLAIEHLFDGRELRVSNIAALKNARRLSDIGRISEATRLFELALPDSVLIKSEGHDAVAAHDTLREWVKAASLFLPQMFGSKRVIYYSFFIATRIRYFAGGRGTRTHLLQKNFIRCLLPSGPVPSRTVLATEVWPSCDAWSTWLSNRPAAVSPAAICPPSPRKLLQPIQTCFDIHGAPC